MKHCSFFSFSHTESQIVWTHLLGTNTSIKLSKLLLFFFFFFFLLLQNYDIFFPLRSISHIIWMSLIAHIHTHTTSSFSNPTNNGAMHSGSSAWMCTVHGDLPRLAPNCKLSRHLATIIIIIFLCYMHVNVHFVIKSYAQLALKKKNGTLFPYWSSVENLLRVRC